VLGVVDLHLLLEFLHLRRSASAGARARAGAKAGARARAGAKAGASPGPGAGQRQLGRQRFRELRRRSLLHALLGRGLAIGS